MSTAHRVGMTGHAGLPPLTAELVTAALRDTLRPYTLNLVGVTMLGPGADQLFARVVLELGGTLYVVQPTTGMQYRDGTDDTTARLGYDELYSQASHVWDGQPSRGLGGTADVVRYARERGVPVEVIWPEGATR